MYQNKTWQCCCDISKTWGLKATELCSCSHKGHCRSFLCKVAWSRLHSHYLALIVGTGEDPPEVTHATSTHSSAKASHAATTRPRGAGNNSWTAWKESNWKYWRGALMPSEETTHLTTRILTPTFPPNIIVKHLRNRTYRAEVSGPKLPDRIISNQYHHQFQWRFFLLFLDFWKHAGFLDCIWEITLVLLEKLFSYPQVM